MKILLLAGTAEARELATALAERGIPAVASLAGATDAPAPLALPTRIGGFGGAEPFARYLADEGIGAVLDATHPFAARISARSAVVCAELGYRYLQLVRRPWVPFPEDRWTVLRRMQRVWTAIPEGATVFAATGRSSLSQLCGNTRRVYLRVIDPPDAPFPFAKGGYVVGRPPFTVQEEIALFQRLGVEWLIAKNSGGTEGLAKIAAARSLGLSVAMLERPPAVDPAVDTVEEALNWVAALG